MATQLSKTALRQKVRRVGRAIYWRLPVRWRDSMVEFSYRHAGALFKGFSHYEVWRGRRRDDGRLHSEFSVARLTDLNHVTPLGGAPGRIAVHAHVYYLDLAREFAQQLRHMPYLFDLYVSVTSDEAGAVCERVFGRLPSLGELVVEKVPNKGRDIAPMICTFGARLRTYDFIAHIHTKKSLYNNGATNGWREYLLSSLFGSGTRLRRIFSLLNDGAGMVYPQTFHRVPYAGCTWLANRGAGQGWCTRLGLGDVPRGYFDFPVGSMFWARMDALSPLFDAGITLDDFDDEAGQNDGTFAHVLERLLGVVVRNSGRRLAILRDTATPSWSPWRFEQYLHRPRKACEARLADPEIHMVAFDIFDTLLTRPLIDPEQVKAIVARRAGGALGQAYRQWRVAAEQSARARAGRDVGLEAIVAELGRMAGLDEADRARLLALELEVELASVSPRPDALELFRYARAAGKRVVLASDMFLPASAIAALLERHGFAPWDALYVSSEVGVRKDSGALYAHILEREGFAPEQVIMIGDNERSDLQIPGDAGLRTLHVMRPVELARAMPRLGPVVEEVERGDDLDANLGLGLLVRGMFGRLHYHDGFDPAAMVPEPDAENLGYAICGPLVFAFCQWLIDRARADGVERLYFLSREGQFLKMVYDQVAAGVADAPPSAYLVLSRRTLNVPAIGSLDDVMRIAGAHYAPAPLETFVRERFGLELDGAMMQELIDRGLWERSELVEVSAAGLGRLPAVLEALLPAIVAQGEQERPALMAYLKAQQLGEGHHAVVDVGFSGTIQRGLNALLGGGIHGYYMATLNNTLPMETEFGVRACGAYFDHAPLDAAPLFIRKSFAVEKMLSADDTQVMRYVIDAGGTPRAEFRPLTKAEEAVFPQRAALRRGALRFVAEAIQVRDELCPDFRFPLELAADLFERFVGDMSAAEREVTGAIVLDDHYCGRGLVN